MRKLLFGAVFAVMLVLLVSSVSATLGVDWTQVTASAPGWDFRGGSTGAVSRDNQLFSLDSRGGGVSSSSDGLTWTPVSSGAGWGDSRQYFGVAAFDGKFWVLGGYNPVGYVLNDVWSSPDGSTWTRVTANAASGKRYGAGVVVFDNKLWMLGGFNGTDYLNDVWSSPDGATWTEVTGSASWPARLIPAAVAFDSKLWVLGGVNTGGLLTDVWSSPDGVTWTEATATPGWDGGGLGAGAFNGQLWALGDTVYSSSDGINWTQTVGEPWVSLSGLPPTINVLETNDTLWALGDGVLQDGDGFWTIHRHFVYSSQGVACNPSWSCSSHRACSGGVERCTGVTDAHTCGLQFVDAYSTYDVVCASGGSTAPKVPLNPLGSGGGVGGGAGAAPAQPILVPQSALGQPSGGNANVLSSWMNAIANFFKSIFGG